MKRIGFIGLGIMGVPMVRNLCKAGMDVTIIENGHGNKEAIAELKEKGVRTAPTARETARNQDVVITMLPNGRIVKDVLTGPDGVLAGITPGTVLIDSSSVAPAESKQFAALAQEAGCPFLDAPVSGGEPGAIAGTLAFMIGGDERVAGKVRDVFDAMGSSAVVTGPNGAGSVTKLCNQIMCFINIAAVSEALVLAQKAGADPKKVYEAVRGGLAGSAILEQKSSPYLWPRFCSRRIPGKPDERYQSRHGNGTGTGRPTAAGTHGPADYRKPHAGRPRPGRQQLHGDIL